MSSILTKERRTKYPVMPRIQEIQNILTQKVKNNLYYFIQVNWDDNMGCINVLVKKHKLFDKVLELTASYSKYYNREYKIKYITVKEIKNKNPHIKINIPTTSKL